MKIDMQNIDIHNSTCEPNSKPKKLLREIEWNKNLERNHFSDKSDLSWELPIKVNDGRRIDTEIRQIN